MTSVSDQHWQPAAPAADAPEWQADIASREGECRSCDRARDTEAQLVSGDDSLVVS
jgi:hypothetical protein